MNTLKIILDPLGYHQFQKYSIDFKMNHPSDRLKREQTAVRQILNKDALCQF